MYSMPLPFPEQALLGHLRYAPIMMAGADLRTMINEADEALYLSKQTGKTRYTFYPVP